MKTQSIVAALMAIGMFMVIGGAVQAAAIFSFEISDEDANLTYPAASTTHDDALYGLTYSETVALDFGTAADLTDDIISNRWPDAVAGLPPEHQYIPVNTTDDIVLTYTLTEAFDINEIRLYTNNKSFTRMSQSYDVAYSTDGVNYTTIISDVTNILTSSTDDTDYLMSRVVDDSGASLASAATHLRFALHPVAGYDNIHSAVYEIDAFGTTPATVPEPNTAALLLVIFLFGITPVWRRFSNKS